MLRKVYQIVTANCIMIKVRRTEAEKEDFADQKFVMALQYYGGNIFFALINCLYTKRI